MCCGPTKSIVLSVTDPTRLPTVLTCIALRIPEWRVINERETHHRWRICLDEQPAQAVLDALDLLSTHEVEIL